MNISILTLFPQLYDPFLKTSIIGKALEKKVVAVNTHDLFTYCAPKERIDAPTYGPGDGVLIRPDVIEQAIIQQEKAHGPALKIFFSPQGKKLDQSRARSLAKKIEQAKHTILLAPRYEGIDERVQEYYADETVSIGDYVLMGGDLPAMVFLETILRFIPGVIGKQGSVEQDSFTGPFVDYPEYTQPLEWKGMHVPEIIRSGNHAAIQEWREQKAAKKTVVHHFGWLRSSTMNSEQKKLATHQIPSHYVTLMHTDIVLDNDRIGNTSITSFDIHDIARSAATYGLKGHFLVSPLKDQQKIARKLLSFWHSDVGIDYNPQRARAVENVAICDNLDEVIAAIEQKEGKKPLLIATSAKQHAHAKKITYYDQEAVWVHDRPVLFLLGTGRGLAETVLQRCDFLLGPVFGFSNFNHLSVRSAAAIIFDRWLGINPK